MSLPDLRERHRQLAPFEKWEVRLVRHALDHPGVVHPRDEATLRYAFAMARLVALPGAGGEVPVFPLLAELRERLTLLLGAAFEGRTPDALLLGRQAPRVREAARLARSKLVVALGDRVSPRDLEQELVRRALVIACGGGGGAGYVNLGAFALLESAGLRPALLAGSSMGSVVGLFRSRSTRFDVTHVPQIVGELHARRMFRPSLGGADSWSLPSPVRLALREGIGPYFTYDGVPLRLRDLTVPFLVTVTGIRRSLLPRSTRDRLARAASGPMDVFGLARNVLRTLGDLATAPELLVNLVLGDSPATREFDAMDAAGYSSSVPGALHYELGRDAPLETARLRSFFDEHDLWRLTDGGVADNVPARSAWEAVQRGRIGTRNTFILALDGFSPRLASGLWLPLQRVAWENVRRSIPYAHLYVPFRRPPSPIELLPSAARVMHHVENAKRELVDELPFVQRMMEPLPGVAALQAA